MASSTIKGRVWTRKEDETLCVRGSSQTSEGVWTRVSKKYLEFYEGTTPLNKYLHPSLNKWHQALLAAASRHGSDANYYDERAKTSPLASIRLEMA
ncbi:hypothetical protein DVH24_002340 [Malus domestica]|uniref:Myb-like domain-containing protein n=1 Tax=Malus domestica TaxID=3750 RepID=A0A498I9D1_MALDO|nr:hypothetical protein DVH24_002340 [Malus domestica]